MGDSVALGSSLGSLLLGGNLEPVHEYFQLLLPHSPDLFIVVWDEILPR